MSIVCEIQKAVIQIEKNEHDAEFLSDTLKDIQPNYYNRCLVVLMV